MKKAIKKNGEKAIPGLFILIFMCAVGPFGDTEYTPSMPTIAKALGVSYSSIQFSMTAYLIGFAAFRLLYGPLSDRYGRKPILYYGVGSYIVGTVFCAFGSSLPWLIGGRFIQGMGICSGSVISGAAIRDAYPEEQRDKVFAKVNAAFGLAPASGPLVGGFLENYFGWRVNFYVLLGLGVLLFIAILILFPETNTHPEKDALKPKKVLHYFGMLFSERVFLPASILMGLAIALLYSALIEVPSILIEQLHMPPRRYYVVAIILVLGFLFGSLLCNWLVSRMRHKFIILLGFAFWILGGLLMIGFILLNLVNMFSMMGCLMVCFFGIALLLPVCNAAALAPFESIAGYANATIGCIQMALGALGTVVVSFLHNGKEWALPELTISLGVVAVIIFFFTLWRFERLPGEPSRSANPAAQA